MSRSKWKSPFLDNFILDGNFEKISKIWSRRSVIPSYLIGKMVLIHNGKIFKKLFINREKVGYKFGEFCSTRLFVKKKVKKKK